MTTAAGTMLVLGLSHQTAGLAARERGAAKLFHSSKLPTDANRANSARKTPEPY